MLEENWAKELRPGISSCNKIFAGLLGIIGINVIFNLGPNIITSQCLDEK